MTRYWPTLILALVLAGLGGYLYLVELPSQRMEDAKEATARKVLPFEESAVTELTVTSMGETTTMTLGPKQSWRITHPIAADADPREVQAMLRTLATARITRIVDEQATALAPFGLEQPSTVVALSAGDKQETFSIGDIGPLSSTLYVLRGSDQKVLLTDMAPKDFLRKSLLTFRRKELVSIDRTAIEKLRLTYPPTEIVLSLSNGKSKQEWRIEYPIEAPADQTEVRTMLFRLEDLKALAIIDPGPDREALASRLTTPTVKIGIASAGQEQTLKIYQPDPSSGEAYAEMASDSPIYKVSPASLKDLTKDLFTLRDKRLLGAELPDIARLSVKTRDEEYVLTRSNDHWVLEDQPMDTVRQDVTDLFVSRVVNLPAEGLVLKNRATLGPYGLVAPAAEFVAADKGGKIIGKLSVGNQVSGLVYAIGDRLPGIYQARADILTQVPSRQSLLSPPEQK